MDYFSEVYKDQKKIREAFHLLVVPVAVKP